MRKIIVNRAKSFSKDEKGATMVEYAIVVGLIAIVAITAVTYFQGSLSAAFSNLGSQTGVFTGSSIPAAPKS